MKWLRDLVDRVLGRSSEEDTPQRTQAELDTDELRREALAKEEEKRDKGGDPPLFNV